MLKFHANEFFSQQYFPLLACHVVHILFHYQRYVFCCNAIVFLCSYHRLVTPNTKILFQIFSHSTFRRDHLLAEARLDLHNQLIREQGKFDHLNVVLDLKVRRRLTLFFTRKRIIFTRGSTLNSL